jgi:peroxiredoxin Q/BCP
MIPQTGQSAPDFRIDDSDGNRLSLKDYSGKWLVLYCYPKDNTSGCTLEAREFSALHADFASCNASVVGVSPDSCSLHRKFIGKESIPFTLLSDPDQQLLQAYGVWREKKMYGRSYMGVVRSTFLIDPKGVICKTWEKVKVPGHAAEVLQTLRDLQS